MPYGGYCAPQIPLISNTDFSAGKEGMVQRQHAVSDEVGVIGGMGWGWRD